MKRVIGVTDNMSAPLEVEQFHYVPTHWSINDGSNAMAVDLGPGLYLTNEDGFEWQADPAEWRTADQMLECKHCGRNLVDIGEDSLYRYVDPFAGTDIEFGDGIWRETCDSHDTFTAEHEPLVIRPRRSGLLT